MIVVIVLLFEIALGASSSSVRTVPNIVVVMRQKCSIVSHALVFVTHQHRIEERVVRGCGDRGAIVGIKIASDSEIKSCL
jgi:hypothetical protein